MQIFIPAVKDKEPSQLVEIKKTVRNKEQHRLNAFKQNDKVLFEFDVSRRLGVCKVILEILSDKRGETLFFQCEYTDTRDNKDVFCVKINPAELCDGDEKGLFYYTPVLYMGEEALYVSSQNNVDFTFTNNREKANPFRLLVYKNDYKTPDWAKNAVMYHIFVDRFAKSELHNIPCRENAKINENWEKGVPEYGAYPGAFIENNEFFGGSLYGIIEKLDYLTELGVNTLYLSPIFKAYSNHKYDTGNYMQIDEMFGGEEAFEELLKQTKKRNMHVILDGVFNHTGDDSIYFNKYGRYNSVGAYQSENSPYHDWFIFNEFPEDYESWWGIKILPKLNNNRKEVREYLLGENGVVRHYLKMGIDGWRLDVADELPSDFLTELRKGVKNEKKNALVLGEVWENAADKTAYSQRREYLSGNQLDSVMNYPIKNAIIDFVKNKNAKGFYDIVTDIYSSYPPETSAVVMNLVGTHDTERILTVLGEDRENELSNSQKAINRLTAKQRKRGIRLLKIASVLQFTLPGMPSVFYADEVGLEGYGDPFCRMPFPWNSIDEELLSHYKKIIGIKRSQKALKGAFLDFSRVDRDFVCYTRENGDEKIIVAVNMAEKEKNLDLDGKYALVYDSLRTDCYDEEMLFENTVAVLGENVIILKKIG